MTLERMPFIVAIVIVLVVLMFWVAYYCLGGTPEVTSSIEDPIERGLAYIAAAIIIHACLRK
jgi:flagellar biosynthesis protein FliQ